VPQCVHVHCRNRSCQSDVSWDADWSAGDLLRCRYDNQDGTKPTVLVNLTTGIGPARDVWHSDLDKLWFLDERWTA
jgi:hypothetical protein